MPTKSLLVIAAAVFILAACAGGRDSSKSDMTAVEEPLVNAEEAKEALPEIQESEHEEPIQEPGDLDQAMTDEDEVTQEPQEHAEPDIPENIEEEVSESDGLEDELQDEKEETE